MPPPPTYSQAELVAAIQAFKEEGLSLREAGRIYNVPRDTIRRKSKETIPMMKRPGPNTVLGREKRADKRAKWKENRQKKKR